MPADAAQVRSHRRMTMQGSPLPREAHRRPDLDLVAGPLEAASLEASEAKEPPLRLVELPDRSVELATQGER